MKMHHHNTGIHIYIRYIRVGLAARAASLYPWGQIRQRGQQSAAAREACIISLYWERYIYASISSPYIIRHFHQIRRIAALSSRAADASLLAFFSSIASACFEFRAHEGESSFFSLSLSLSVPYI